MRNPRFTIGILGFLVFVFCVDTAISDAQIFRRRLCNPCWQQQQCCPQEFVDLSIFEVPFCEVTTDSCGEETCTIKYNEVTREWEIISHCPSGSCFCPIPIVIGGEYLKDETRSETCSQSWRSLARLDRQFTLCLGTDAFGNNQTIGLVLSVPGTGEENFSMNRITVNANNPANKGKWNIDIKFDTDRERRVRKTPVFSFGGDRHDHIKIERPLSTSTQQVILATLNNSHNLDPDGPENSGVTVSFGHFLIEVQRIFE